MNALVLAKLLALPELEAYLAQVEATLAGALELDNDAIVVPARRVVLGGGKRLRPALTIASAAASGDVDTPGVIAGATSVELVQAGSLVHDDIMDEAHERRGVPTVNALEGSSHAILVGDYLLARAGQLAASVSGPVAGSLANAIADLCHGQSLETTSLFDPDRSVAAYLRSIEGKTAALFRASCEIGALAAGATPAVTEALARFGTSFGMAFQIVDDVLDIVSTSEAMGKPVGHDAREGVYGLPLILAAAGPDGIAVRSRLGHQPTEGEIAIILTLVRASAGIDEALDRARAYNREAADALAVVPPGPTRDGLAQLPDAYVDWVLDDKAPDLAVSAAR
jgi:geranylgeranyl pyrophosphate synthase